MGGRYQWQVTCHFFAGSSLLAESNKKMAPSGADISGKWTPIGGRYQWQMDPHPMDGRYQWQVDPHGGQISVASGSP